MSLVWGENWSTSCDNRTPALTQAIEQVRSANIAPIISSGTMALTSGVDFPACISSAIVVGSTTKSNIVSSFSNSSALVTFLAPGDQILSSVRGGTYDIYSGTSMAAPHVAGAFAAIRSRLPSLSVGTLTQYLQRTGSSITDTRNGLTRPRIDVGNALNSALGAVLSPILGDD